MIGLVEPEELKPGDLVVSGPLISPLFSYIRFQQLNIVVVVAV